MKYHKGMEESWKHMSTATQMANIGSEVMRSINGRGTKNAELASERALELIDLSLLLAKKSARKELARVREVFLDYLQDNYYNSTAKQFDEYFIQFTILARYGERS